MRGRAFCIWGSALSYTYTTWQTALSTLTAIPTSNADFQAILPSVIDYAEQRMYRELDLLAEDVRDSSSSTSTGNRNFTLPTSLGTFQVISGLNIITPASTTPDLGTRNPCTPVSRDVLDFIYPSVTGSGVPSMFSYFSQATNQTNILLGPWPDAVYTVEVIGKIIPAPLSATNTTTFLTSYLPDAFLAASMIFMSGYLKNFGAQADDVRQAQSWSQQYDTLMASANLFEARKRFAGASWTSKAPEPAATPQRG